MSTVDISTSWTRDSMKGHGDYGIRRGTRCHDETDKMERETVLAWVWL